MGTNRFDKLFATLKSISSFNTASQQFSNINNLYLFIYRLFWIPSRFGEFKFNQSNITTKFK
jgi:hypothetical protein